MSLKLSIVPPDDDPESKKAELTEHLAELRTRLMRSLVYIVVGVTLVYIYYKPLLAFISAPINKAVANQPFHGLAFHNFIEPFMLSLQISMVGGVIVAVPFIVSELWMFIAPGLTRTERRGVVFVAPMSVLLFVMGVSCAMLILPMAIHWFLGFLPTGAILLQNPLDYVVFVVKLMLVFGLLFQLPVVLMFLGRVGIINSALMIKYWRQISVALFTLAMVVAPSNDPGTMLALAVPLTILFLGSIWLVKLVERKPEPEV